MRLILRRLQRNTETRLARFAKIALICRVKLLMNVENAHASNLPVDETVSPVVNKPAYRSARLTAKQRWQIWVFLFQIQGNGKGIPDNSTTIIDHRHRFLPPALDRSDLGEQRRHGFHREPLVGQSHAGAPTGRGKPQITVGGAKIIQLDGHENLLKVGERARMMPPSDSHGQKNLAQHQISRKTNAPCPQP